MANSAPLDEAEVKKFVADWYHALDVHVPPDEVLAMVTEEGLEFHIPEGIFRGQEGFSEVYHNWTHTFFDEVHTLRDVQVTPDGQQADLKVVVNWKGTIWNPPDANSQNLDFDAYQTWVVERSPKSGRPVIKKYIVDELRDLSGSPGA